MGTVSRRHRLVALALGFTGVSACAEASERSEPLDEPGVTLAAEVHREALLADVESCAAGRFDETASGVCAAAGTPLSVDGPLPGSRDRRSFMGTMDAYGSEGHAYVVRLASNGDGTFSGAVRFRVAVRGESVVYLGSPNVPVALRRVDADGVATGEPLAPLCGRYLPKSPSPAGYDAACSELVRGAYAFELDAGARRGLGADYELVLGPSANSSVRVAVATRRSPPDLRALPECALTSTRADACAASGLTTAVRGRPFGSAPLATVTAGGAYGVHLAPLAAANEGAIRFTPPYTADYTVYVGTPRVGVALLGTAGEARTTCASYLDDPSCPDLRAAFTFSRLTGGQPYRLELGRIAPQSWVRTLVVPTSADSDGDGWGDTLPRATSVVAGRNHSCALLDTGAVRCWGANAYGQLGYGHTRNLGDDEIPATAEGNVELGGKAIQLAAGAAHTCALLDTGAVRCWGQGWWGQLGYGNMNTLGDDESPASAGDVNVGGRVVRLVAGDAHTCAVLYTGAVRCWGNNSSGQLGYRDRLRNVGTYDSPASAGNVNVGGKVVELAAGWEHTCALLDSGAVRCWGYIHPTPIPDTAGRVTHIAAGAAHACAVLDTGAVRCWGAGGSGRLGYYVRDEVLRGAPSAGDVDLGEKAVRVAAGGAHSCALLTTGAVRCWGAGDQGQLGYGNRQTLGDDESPASAGDVPVGGPAAQVAAGNVHTCALLATGAVRCWGYGFYGALGYGDALGPGDRYNLGDDELPLSAGDVPF